MIGKLPASDEYRAIYKTMYRWCERHDLRPHLCWLVGQNDNRTLAGRRLGRDDRKRPVPQLFKSTDSHAPNIGARPKMSTIKTATSQNGAA